MIVGYYFSWSSSLILLILIQTQRESKSVAVIVNLNNKAKEIAAGHVKPTYRLQLADMMIRVDHLVEC